MKIRCVAACLMAMAVSASAVAGDLNPPAGAVAETGRFGPRTEISAVNTPGDVDSLFKIIRPGSYYLGSNITGVDSKSGIEIASSGVTIDLMGFELLGVLNSLDGVTIGSGLSNVRLHSGSVRLWGRHGISAGLTSSSIFHEIAVSNNVSAGILTGFNCVLENCTAQGNGSVGIGLGGSSIARGCVAYNNGQGINAGSNCVINACSVRLNDGPGISTGFGSAVIGCSARDNGGTGILCLAAATVRGCATYSNDVDGINVGSTSSVCGNNSAANTSNGIIAGSDCMILQNGCFANGAAGIRVAGNGVRVDSNNATDNTGSGIHVSGSGNLIIRNSASGNNGNYNIGAGNKVGLTVLAPNSANFNGSTGGSGVGTSNPWANISY